MNIVTVQEREKEFAAFLLKESNSSLYLPLSLEYSKAYASKREFKNLSFGVESNGKILCVFVLYLNCFDGEQSLDGCGHPAFCTLSHDISEKELKTVDKRINNKLEDILNEYPQAKLIFKEQLIGGQLSSPGLFLLEKGAAAKDFFCNKIDLSNELSELASNVRKSYKSLINWGRNNLAIEILDSTNVNKNDVEEFRKLHIQVAGRETRSAETWDLQYQMIKNSEAFIVRGLLDGNLVTAVFCQVNQMHCYYGVSASVRELFDKPMSHALLWGSIEYAKKIGCHWYETGEQLFSGLDNYDKKNLDIAKFKRGFGGKIYLQLLLILSRVNNGHK